jgi:Flp pilus assembly secretin CpaC
MIRLPRGARSAFIADPTIADIQLASPTTIIVYAKKGGDTVLYAQDSEDAILLNTIVRVRPLEVQVWRPEKVKEPTKTTGKSTTIATRNGNTTTYERTSTSETSSD